MGNRPKKVCFQPLSEEHSIERFGLIIELSPPLPNNRFSGIESFVKKNDFLRAFFNRADRKEYKREHLAVAAKEKPAVQKNKILILTRAAPQKEWELYIDQRRVAIYCFNYTRWAHVSCTIIDILNSIATSVLQRNVQNILMGYIDIFLLSGQDHDVVDAKKLISPKSKYISHQFFNANLSIETSIKTVKKIKETNRLVGENFSIELKEYKNSLAYFIDTNHELRLNNEKIVLSTQKGLKKKYIKEIIDMLHEENKKLLGNILAPSILKKIGMEG